MTPHKPRVPGEEPYGASPPRQGTQTGPLTLGRLAMTAGATLAMSKAGVPPSHLLMRHRAGDWGDASPDRWAENNLAAVAGGEIVSQYRLDPGGWVWILTHADRRQTTLMTPAEWV